MVLDAWEHAYYLQYQNEKAKYFDAIWNVWNWKDIAERFAEAQKRSALAPAVRRTRRRPRAKRPATQRLSSSRAGPDRSRTLQARAWAAARTSQPTPSALIWERRC